LIAHGAVAVEDDTIAAVGTYAELKERYPHAEEMGSERHIVVPGLINTHHHGWGMTLFQLGAIDDYLESWILDNWRVKPLDKYLDVLYADMKNIRSGVTTLLHAAYFRDWGNFEGETQAALRAHSDSGIRVAYGVQVLDQNTFVYQSDDEFLATLPRNLADRIRAVLAETAPATSRDFFTLLPQLQEEYASHPRIKIMMAPVAPQWCSDALLRKVRQLADSNGMGMHIHCLESPYQREFGLRTYGKTTVEHLKDMGFLGPDVSLGHAVWLTDRDMDICADTGTSVCHNASSNLRLRVGIMPAARMLEKGVNVSIGMDGTTLNDDEDMLQEMRLVAKLHRLPRGLEYTTCPTSFDVLRMATVNGARSTTIGPRIGRLLPGCLADAVLIDLEAFACKPYLDPSIHVVDALLYRARGMDVDTVMIGGEMVLANKQFTRLDENKIITELAEIAEAAPIPRIQRWMNIIAELRPHVVRFYEGWETPAYQPCYTTNSVV
jgi:cytosine/adenosine deaminase-related metal-dependent hydrolase